MGQSWAYEVKWDGFRALVSTEGPLRVRSRRGWNMTPFVAFLEELPVRAVLDGEIVAFDGDGKPDFPLVRRGAAPRLVDPADFHRLRRFACRRQKCDREAVRRPAAHP